MNKRYLIIIAAGLLFSVGALAQNINPHVLVTNDYEGKVVEVPKKDVAMAVPDSLLKFNYNVDYSVFANPYNGSYEFHPYLVEMRPDAALYDGKVFYANAGAGYSLHPEADIVWTPVKSGKFYLGVYDSYRGYFGEYRNLVDDNGKISEYKNGSRSGRYMKNKLGVAGTYVAQKSIFSFDVEYEFMNSADSLCMHVVNGGNGTLRLRSNPLLDSRFFYDFSLTAQGVYDRQYLVSNYKSAAVDGRIFGNFGFRQGTHRALKFDVAVEYAHAQGCYNGEAFGFSATPKYVFDYDKLKCSVGAKVSFVSTGMTQIVYPDIYIDYFFGEKRFDLYAKVTGGDKIQTCYDYLGLDPFIRYESDASKTGVETERFNASAGLKGSLGTHFQYDIFAGYVMLMNGLGQSVCKYDDGSLSQFFKRSDYNRFVAGFDLFWKSERLDVDAKFRYTDVDAYRKGKVFVMPAPLKADLAATYNISNRIYFGVDLSYEAERKVRGILSQSGSFETAIPWCLDLGAHAEFKFNRWLSVWAKGGNFLGKPIQKYLLHAEQGPYFVAGISVRL